MENLDLFESVDKFLIMTLANAVKVIDYKYGDLILQEGDVPKGLYIIAKGQCSVSC